MSQEAEDRKDKIIASLRDVVDALGEAVTRLEDTPSTDVVGAAKVFAAISKGAAELADITGDAAVELTLAVMLAEVTQ